MAFAMASATDLARALLAAAAPGLVLYAAVSDLLHRTIPNRICLVLAGLGLLWQGSTDPFRIWDPLAASLLVVIPGLWVWQRGWLGGGDIKLLAALAIWSGIADLPSLLLVVGLAGGGLALLYILTPRLLSVVTLASAALSEVGGQAAPQLLRAFDLSRGLPYGIAIAAGGIWLFATRFLSDLG